MESVTVGGLLSRTYSTFTGNFTAFFLIAALVTVISNGFILAVGFEDVLLTGSPDPSSIVTGQAAISLLLAVFLFVGLYMVASGAITFGTIRYLNNDPATVGECISRGIAVAIPLFVMGLVVGLGVGFGFMLLIVPGVFLLVMWYVAAPALIVERVGIFGSLGRSAELTKGARWKILGVVAIIYGISFVVGLILESVALFLGPMAGVLIGALVDALFLAFGAVTAAVVYQELRVAKEGIGISDMANVFN